MFERKEALYNLLLNNATNDYMTRDEICNALPQFYPRHEEIGRDMYHSTAYNDMRDDIDEIQRDRYFEKIIVSKGSSYKIASTYAEAEDEINKLEYPALRRLAKTTHLKYKLQTDKQLKAEGDEIREVKALKE